MIKLIIAEDEAIEREVYKVLINRYFPGISIAAEAETGRQAIELYHEHNPELVLMDIKMPGINGIEAISEIRKKSRNAKFIIVSAYDYFDYAKQALKNGVEDYLLKPVVKDEFIKALKKVLDKIETENRMTREELKIKERIKSMLPVIESETALAIMTGDDDKIRHYASLLDTDISYGYIMIGAVRGYDPLTGSNSEDLASYKLSKIQEFIKENIPGIKPALISSFVSRKILFVFPGCPNGQMQDFKNIAYKRAEKIKNLVKDNFNVDMYFAVGDFYTGLSGIRSSYNQAFNIISNIGCFEMDIVNYSDVECGSTNGFRYPYELEKQLMEKIKLGMTEQSMGVFNRIFEYTVELLNGDVNRIKIELFELRIVLSRLMYEMGNGDIDGLKNFIEDKEIYFNYTNINEIYHAFENDIKLISNKFNEVRNARVKNLVYTAVDYIKENYMKDLTLEHVARTVCLSPNYFSKLFKSEFNKSFIDYLTSVRIEAAKELILKTNKSVQDICWDVGYNDPNYFTKVFKKLTNHTPSEFKDKKLL